MRESIQFNSIVVLIKSYQNQQPLHRFLQQHFRNHKQMGSRDRRLFSDWIYNYYRLGKSLCEQTIETKLSIANFLMQQQSSELLNYALSSHTVLQYSDIEKLIAEKTTIVQQQYPFSLKDIFPFSEWMSDDLDEEQFALSILSQPKVWIRVRKQFAEQVKGELNELSILFEESKEQPLAWSVPQRTNLDTLKTLEQGFFEIQDISSQRTGNYFQPKPNEHWYDCCAASGGKSLLLQSIESSVQLTVSDKRNSVLENLHERFKRAGIKNYQSIVADLANRIPDELSNQQYDGIILDAPCSGSGTWARTPEQISFFQTQQINHYKELQRTILKNVVPLLKKGKSLIYITCSVFKEENEVQVEYAKQMGLMVEMQELIQSAKEGGDALFVCRLIKR